MSNSASIQSHLRQHEQWLIGLRRDPSKTLRQIKDELYEQKGITVSNNQLEIFFRKSKQPKNLSRDSWRTVYHFLDSQKKFGCVYNLYISEKLVLENTLRRNRRRVRNLHPMASSLREANEILTELPVGVTVELRLPRDSPGPSLQHRINSQPMLEAGSTTNSSREPSVLHGRISADSAILEPIASIADVNATSSSTDSLSAIIDIPSPYQGQLVDFPATADAHQTPPGMNFRMMPEIERGAEFVLFDPPVADYRAREFPLFNSPLNSHLQVDLTNQDDSMIGLLMPAERDDGSQASVTPMECAQLLLRDFGSVISRRGPHEMHKLLPTAEELLSNLESLVSMEDTEEFHDPFHVVGGNVLFPDQFVTLFLYATVNNFAGIDTIPMKLIMRFMNQHQPFRSRILNCLTKGEFTIFSSALTEKLLKAAIEAGDSNTVHDVLALKFVKPDDIIFMEGGCRRTPLERASTMRHFKIMELLLRFGADVNKT
ncbi:hypothetical protein GGS24DRAFT_110489 [Hypoxylon argillaceum]|nr:hypothetical protein GGS24DRAFT_110489 [Hypoxylon argillaceum]